MHLNMLVQKINDKLAGETLMYDQLQVFLDEVIDDINSSLNSCYPAFSEFSQALHEFYPNYCFFPDKYIRSVVIPGAAYKFYTTDEEGANVAPKYEQEYRNNLYKMQRDFSFQVPPQYQDSCHNGMLFRHDECPHKAETIDLRSWFLDV